MHSSIPFVSRFDRLSRESDRLLETVKSGIRVNVVAPGPIDTGMLTRFTGTPEKKAALVGGVPLNRMGTPEELAAAIVFMASPEAAFITGTTLVVDGGKLAR